MHKEILFEEQLKIFPELKVFSGSFGLVGGTAIALHLGHRRSIDFNLATAKPIDSASLRKKLLGFSQIEKVAVNNTDEYTVIAGGIKFTFFNYPFPITFPNNIDGVISIPDISTLAAMKAYALGRRAKWKDYVDLFYIIKTIGSIEPIINQAKLIFAAEFNEKNFRAELAYFDDIDRTEQVIFTDGFEVKDDDIKRALINYSI